MVTQDLYIKISSLPSDLKQELETFVDGLLKRRKKIQPEKNERPIGIMKGEFWMSDDFDGPLDDFKEYME